MSALKKRHEYNLAVELSENQQDAILDGILNGQSIRDITSKLNIPVNWVSDYAAKYPDFAKRLRSIRELYTHETVHTLLTIADDAHTMAEVQRAKVKSENIKWSASKVIPDVYGDNINLNVNHSLDLSSVLLAAENRIIPILTTQQRIDSNTIDITESNNNEELSIIENKSIDIDELL